MGRVDRAEESGAPVASGGHLPRHDRAQVVEAIAGRLMELRQALPLKLLVLYEARAGEDHTAFGNHLQVVYRAPRRDDAYDLVQNALATTGLEAQVYSHKALQSWA